jgi:hypothetical protein
MAVKNQGTNILCSAKLSIKQIELPSSEIRYSKKLNH